jgi:hypothetical protein
MLGPEVAECCPSKTTARRHKEHEDVMWGYGMWWGGLIWLVLIAVLVWTLVATNRPGRPTRPNALDILELERT